MKKTNTKQEIHKLQSDAAHETLKTRREKRTPLIKKAIELKEKGFTMGNIASEVGVSKRTVQRWFNEVLDYSNHEQKPIPYKQKNQI